MTKDNAHKEATRNRMKHTGESYAVAMRKTAQPKFEVIELGEDGDNWLVVGTLDINEARKAVHQWLDNMIWPSIAANGFTDSVQDYHEQLDEDYVVFTPAEDFYFRPAIKDDPFSDAFVERASNHPEKYSGEELLTAVLVKA